MSGIRRRDDARQQTLIESAIMRSLAEVESLGADVRLTDASVLLRAAFDSVADFRDGVDSRRTVTQIAGLIGDEATG